jgi:RNA polymerase sigma-70 factor (ECF subfamily)
VFPPPSAGCRPQKAPKESPPPRRLPYVKEAVRQSMDTMVGERVPGVLDAILGDEVAFREWYDAALPRVYGYLLSRCGRDRDLAEDLTQQTFVDALRTAHQATGDPVAWLIGIARHRLADHFRAAERRERGFMRLIFPAQPSVTWLGGEDPDGRLEAALRRLPVAQRAAVTLRYVDDLPVREVAALLGRSEGAVESLLSRGKDTLRHAMGQDR